MQYPNHSPWIEQLDNTLEYPKLSCHAKSDVVVVGAGISGVSTAYQILTQTDLSVTLLEARKIGRGASGHNAGQVVLYFEKPFQEIAKEYGLEKAIDGQKALFRGFEVLEDMVEKLRMKKNLEVCEGYMGVRSLEQLIRHLENKFLRDTGGAQFDAIFIDQHWSAIHDLPEQFRDMVTVVDQDFIRQKLETHEYFPVLLTSKKACANSALFCQNALQYLVKHFPGRFHIYEHSPVSEIRLFPDRANEVWVDDYSVKTDEVILCTNGFEHFHIVDLHHSSSRERDKVFHKNIQGLVGYMAGFFAPHKKASAISYYPEAVPVDWHSEKYFYVTRRTFEKDGEKKSLICVGGPDSLVPHETPYDPSTHDPKESYEEIQKFLKQYRTEEAPESFPYTWHGLMGYTHTGLRYIGQDPTTPHLWYNLGCNGVGIVGSVYGGWKIAKILSGTSFPPSIFDPQ
ncbi:FAD-binding oxidoreductase [Candidatus Gracilibacteria bacterium]|nr:FAD-binding oxidoreductase [Candidatus Gracilibacteria bacterium]